MRLQVSSLFLLAGSIRSTAMAECANPYPNAAVPEGFCASVFASDVGASPRGIFFAPNGDLLVSDRGTGEVRALWDDNGDGVSDLNERAVIASVGGRGSNTGFHGIYVKNGYLFVSTSNEVYRFPYDGERTLLDEPELIIENVDYDFEGSPEGTIPGTHTVRVMEFDDSGRMYVHTGAKRNVDPSSTRARIMRFTGIFAEEVEVQQFEEGELFADGVRNENGITFQGKDGSGFLWGVENERDQLFRTDLGSIFSDNPSEELNKFDPDDPGRFYGYPWCWTEYDLQGMGMGRGTQWAERGQSVEQNYNISAFWGVDPYPEYTDEQCRDASMVVPPALALQGHSAPLGLDFYREDVNEDGALPSEWVGDLFVAYHGSWNKAPTTGYKVVRIAFGDDGNPLKTDENGGVLEDVFYNMNRDFGGLDPQSSRAEVLRSLQELECSVDPADRVGCGIPGRATPNEVDPSEEAADFGAPARHNCEETGCCWIPEEGQCFVPANVPPGDKTVEWETRPVEVKISPDGRMFLSSDSTREIIVLSSDRVRSDSGNTGGGLGGGAIAGIVVGAVVGVGLLAGWAYSMTNKRSTTEKSEQLLSPEV